MWSKRDLLNFDKLKSFILNEEIKIDTENKTAKIDYSKNKSGISTKMGKGSDYTPFKTSGKMFDGDIIISGYSAKIIDNQNIQPKDLRKIIYHLIKGKDSEYSLSDDEKRMFITRSIIYLNRYFNKNNISFDIILLPSSSSSLNKIMAEEFAKRFPYDIQIYSDSITKASPDDLKIVGNPSKNVREYAMQVINHLKKMGSVEIKKVPPSLRRFIVGISKIDSDIYKKIEGKNVLLVDDVLTSGATLSDIIRQLRNNSTPNKIYGVTLFKN
jgi:hypothetical protein